VINKSDLSQKIDLIVGAGLKPVPAKNIVRISAKEGTGLVELKKRIADAVLQGNTENSVNIVTNLRHVHALEKAFLSIEAFIKAVVMETSPEFLSVELREALDAIGDITGITTPEDVLNRIFSNFCIGK